MTQPKRAQQTERGRYYEHPKTGQQLVSVTNALGQLGKPALVGWAAKVVAEAAVNRLPVDLPRLRTDRAAVTSELKATVNMSRDRAADLGSAIHHHAEQHIKAGLSVEEMPEEVRPYVAAFVDFLQVIGKGLDNPLDAVVASELTVADPRAGYAGTLDLILDLPLYPRQGSSPPAASPDERWRWVVDIKTSATRPRDSVYGEYSLQLAALASASEMWVEDPEALDGVHVLPLHPRPIGGATLNLRSSRDPRHGWTLLPLPIGSAEREAFLAVVQLTEWSHAHRDQYDTGRGKSAPEGLARKDARSAHRALGRQLRLGKGDDEDTAKEGPAA